jgi:hypothetical protein
MKAAILRNSPLVCVIGHAAGAGVCLGYVASGSPLWGFWLVLGVANVVGVVWNLNRSDLVKPVE